MPTSPRWVAGDEVYGGNPHLRTVLEGRQVGYVLAVACGRQITTRAGKFRTDTLTKKLPKQAWQQLSPALEPKGTASTTVPSPRSPTTGPAAATGAPG